jgi:hypothetical protein
MSEEYSKFKVIGSRPAKEYLRIIPKDDTFDVVIGHDVTLTEAAREFINVVLQMVNKPSVDKSSPANYDMILFCAFRYALGRATYVVDYVVQSIHMAWNNLSDADKQLYVKEILEHKDKFGSIGMDMDTKQWLTIVDRYELEAKKL